MDTNLILMLVIAELRKQRMPGDTDKQIADGITIDLKKFRTYLNNLDKVGIDR